MNRKRDLDFFLKELFSLNFYIVRIVRIVFVIFIFFNFFIFCNIAKSETEKKKTIDDFFTSIVYGKLIELVEELHKRLLNGLQIGSNKFRSESDHIFKKKIVYVGVGSSSAPLIAYLQFKGYKAFSIPFSYKPEHIVLKKAAKNVESEFDRILYSNAPLDIRRRLAFREMFDFHLNGSLRDNFLISSSFFKKGGKIIFIDYVHSALNLSLFREMVYNVRPELEGHVKFVALSNFFTDKSSSEKKNKYNKYNNHRYRYSILNLLPIWPFPKEDIETLSLLLNRRDIMIYNIPQPLAEFMNIMYYTSDLSWKLMKDALEISFERWDKKKHEVMQSLLQSFSYEFIFELFKNLQYRVEIFNSANGINLISCKQLL